MNIRMLTVQDVSEYRELRLQALSLNPEAFLTTYSDYVGRSLDQVASQLAPTDDNLTLGAYSEQGKLVGTVTLVRERALKVRHIANVVAMFVLPEYRRRGIGRVLLSDLITEARQLAGLEQLKLSVVKENNPGVALCRSLGFQVYGVEPNALKTEGGFSDEIHTVLPLTHGVHFNQPSDPAITKDFSHVTINVSDLQQSLEFYVRTLGLKLVHQGRRDAYLEWGKAWVCLQERPEFSPVQQRLGVDHVAFYTHPDEFQAALKPLLTANVPIVRGPMERGGGWTVNFLDPDGTQLEFHTGTLAERLKVWK